MGVEAGGKGLRDMASDSERRHAVHWPEGLMVGDGSGSWHSACSCEEPSYAISWLDDPGQLPPLVLAALSECTLSIASFNLQTCQVIPVLIIQMWRQRQ